jgi:hypothetical protein
MEQEHDSDWSEIEAMKSVGTALARLDKETQARVLRWAVDKFDFAVANAGNGKSPRMRPRDDEAAGGVTGAEQFVDLPALFGSTSPTTESEKALVVGYWLQVIEGQVDLDSQNINAELKNLGHGVLNITRALEGLIGTRPQLVIQTRKSGSAKQARKKYRLTGEGITRVKQMMSRAAASSEAM